MCSRSFIAAQLLAVVAALLTGPSAHATASALRAVGASPRAAAATTVTGTVAGTDQGFLAGASIAIDGPTRLVATSDADGRFTFAGVEPGRYQLRASADGYLPLERPLDVGTASVSIDIVLLRIPSVP
jgi:hypothetical protein